MKTQTLETQTLVKHTGELKSSTEREQNKKMDKQKDADLKTERGLGRQWHTGGAIRRR